MIIELQNFGPIKSFKFDTSKDMHAIFGKNNIGKSYAISAVYLILKNLRVLYENRVFTKMTNEINTSSFHYRKYRKYIKELALGDKVNLTPVVTEILSEYLNMEFIRLLESSLKNTFELSNLTCKFNKKPLVIKLTNNFFEVEICLLNEKLLVQKVSYYPEHESNFVLERRVDGVYIFIGSAIFYDFEDQETLIRVIFQNAVISFISTLRMGINFQNIYFLPVSRSGLYNTLNSFGAIFAELSRNRNNITRKIEIPNMTEPISDYFLNLNTIDKTNVNEHYLRYFGEVEQDVLRGQITIDTDSKKYYYAPTDTDMRLELSFTSSMISEIAPIIAHLKYIIPLESNKPSSILFIEEPEAHLHPEIQILLLEYFVKLSTGNVKIVMTSHSNYIFNKLSNLLIANKIDKEKLSVSLMKMTPEGSVIEDGAMQIDEYGIEDNNFVDVAEQLYEERMSLLEKL
jgi:predicted ATPase